VRKTNKQSLHWLEKTYSDPFVKELILIRNFNGNISSNKLDGDLTEKIYEVIRIYETHRGYALFSDFEEVFKNEISGEEELKEDPLDRFILWTGLSKEFCDAFHELNKNHLILTYDCVRDDYEKYGRVLTNENWVPKTIKTSIGRNRNIGRNYDVLSLNRTQYIGR
jgi:hypothetical protein